MACAVLSGKSQAGHMLGVETVLRQCTGMPAYSIDSLPPPFQRVQFPHRQGNMPGILLGKNPYAPDVVFHHANGFCASTYLPLMQQLYETGLSVLAMDMRAQGQNALPADLHMHGWHIMREDVISLMEQFEKPPVMSGHSLGGTVSLLAASKRPDLAKGVVVFDPPMLPRFLQWMMRMHIVRKANSVHPLVRGALARRRKFQSREFLYSRYEGKFPFSHWEDGFLAGYLLDGLTTTDDGQMQLSCAPEWEAQIYRSHGHDIWGAVKRLELPAKIITGDGKGTVVSERMLAQIATNNSRIETQCIKGYSHFLPMEDSKLAASLIIEFIDQT